MESLCDIGSDYGVSVSEVNDKQKSIKAIEVTSLWMRKMASEDRKNILALIIVTLSFLSVPLLLFLFAVTVYFNVNQIVQFYYTRTPADAVLALLLTIVNIVLLFAIRVLVRWVRR